MCDPAILHKARLQPPEVGLLRTNNAGSFLVRQNWRVPRAVGCGFLTQGPPRHSLEPAGRIPRAAAACRGTWPVSPFSRLAPCRGTSARRGRGRGRTRLRVGVGERVDVVGRLFYSTNACSCRPMVPHCLYLWSAIEKSQTVCFCLSVCLIVCPIDCLTDCLCDSLTDWLTVSVSSRCLAEGNRIF